MKEEASKYRARALIRRARLALAEYKVYKKAAAARKAAQAEVVSRFRTLSWKRKALHGFEWAVQERAWKEEALTRAAKFARAHQLVRLLTQWGYFIGRQRLDREQSKLADAHRRRAALRTGFRVWRRARALRVAEQAKRRAAEEMATKRALRRMLRAWYGWLAARGDPEVWDKRREELCLRAVCRVSSGRDFPGVPLLSRRIAPLYTRQSKDKRKDKRSLQVPWTFAREPRRKQYYCSGT